MRPCRKTTRAAPPDVSLPVDLLITVLPVVSVTTRAEARSDHPNHPQVRTPATYTAIIASIPAARVVSPTKNPRTSSPHQRGQVTRANPAAALQLDASRSPVLRATAPVDDPPAGRRHVAVDAACPGRQVDRRPHVVIISYICDLQHT